MRYLESNFRLKYFFQLMVTGADFSEIEIKPAKFIDVHEKKSNIIECL